MQTDPRKACANQEEKLLWALIHDGIAHPLMALSLFSRWAVDFHDWTSKSPLTAEVVATVGEQLKAALKVSSGVMKIESLTINIGK